MNLSRFAIVGLVTLAGSLAANQDVEAASYHHIDELALRIQRQAADMSREFRLHYRHTSEYGHLVTDARKLYFRARHVHEVAHHHGSVRHLENDLRKLDSLFHHLEELLEHIELSAHGGYHGHVHGETSHVQRLMKTMERDIHHLREDIEEMSHHHHGGHHGDGHVVVRRRPAYYGGGVRIGNVAIRW